NARGASLSPFFPLATALRGGGFWQVGAKNACRNRILVGNKDTKRSFTGLQAKFSVDILPRAVYNQRENSGDHTEDEVSG
ncbi:MAG: hypothetical protein RR065_12675, partial [Clostridia bacterium]